eukprot:jgi/Botrbrau1/7224/Bobra.0021s0009.1
MPVLHEDLVEHQLFGGAILLDFPSRFSDISSFRPIPDNQEVFADAVHDQSIIVEAVEYSSEIPNEMAGEYYLNDLAKQNDAVASSIGASARQDPSTIHGVLSSSYISLVTGMQLAAKGRQGHHTANEVMVQLLVVRLAEHSTDLLISLNTPVFINAESAAAEHAGAGSHTAHLAAPDLFQAIVSTLRIADYGLFRG